jgi:hypothetical protein
MPAGPTLIFDKSALESLSLDEAVLLDNFYMSNITPLFFVECLADLEKCMRGRSTPEQLVGSLADRTPDLQSTPNVYHMTVLTGELSRQFDLRNALGPFSGPEANPSSSAIGRAWYSVEVPKRKPSNDGLEGSL